MYFPMLSNCIIVLCVMSSVFCSAEGTRISEQTTEQHFFLDVGGKSRKLMKYEQYRKSVSLNRVVNLPVHDVKYTPFACLGLQVRCTGKLTDVGSHIGEDGGWWNAGRIVAGNRYGTNFVDYIHRMCGEPSLYAYFKNSDAAKLLSRDGTVVSVEGRVSLVADELGTPTVIESGFRCLTNCCLTSGTDSLKGYLHHDETMAIGRYTSPCREFKLRITAPENVGHGIRYCYGIHYYSATLWVIRFNSSNSHLDMTVPFRLFYSFQDPETTKKVWNLLERVDQVLEGHRVGEKTLNGMCKARLYSQIEETVFAGKDKESSLPIWDELYRLLKEEHPW